ncbi:MAG: hypothetical protein JSS83_20420 [Cyanobacteria bacterium SZAS LIN-3]|nr:hypothetical protein [Cyanobacteria bacterium SZAS LIN-3]
MKANPTEKKLTWWSGSFLLVKLIVLLLVIPLSVPAAGWLTEALVWRYLLCSIDGINLMGGLLEAFALSMALGGFSACVNLLVAVAIDAYRKWKKLPLQKLDGRKPLEIKSWGDIYKNLPGLRAVSQHFVIVTLGLMLLSGVQPVRLNFAGPFELLLSAGVLSACWIFCMSVFSVGFCFYLLKNKDKIQAAEATAAK